MSKSRASASAARHHRDAKSGDAKSGKAARNGTHHNGAHHGHAKVNGKPKLDWFTWFAFGTARLSGRPVTFMLAVTLIAVWAITGPIFQYSDTWQLVINTGTTIVTFLMVFLIQNTQNRDTLALQIKLAELIVAVRGAHNDVATIEDMCDEDLEALHATYRDRAEQTLSTLNRRRESHAE